MIRECLDYLKLFKKGRVLVVGDLILDRYIWGKVDRISPEAPVPVVKVERESVHLGGAANVLGNLTAMGGHAVIVGVTGRDYNGEELIGLLGRAGVDTSGIVQSGDHPTIQKTRIIAHHQQVVRVDREKNSGFSPELSTQILEKVLQKIEEVDVVIISDYGKGVVNADMLNSLTNLPRKPIICVDPKDLNFGNYHGVNVLTPNQSEAERMSGIQITDSASLIKAAGRIFDEVNCQNLLITRGEKGMALFESRDSLFEIPTLAREVYDVSGAGDTVIATYALARAVQAPPRVCALLANTAAGIVVGKLGTAEASSEEIRQVLRKQLKRGK